MHEGVVLDGLSVLLVEDDSELQRMLTAELEQAGLAVTAAGSFRGAQDLLDDMEFDLAVLDVMLPDGSGLDLARCLKGQDPAIGIIMLTRYDQASWRVSGFDAGADLYLPKPISPDVLRSAIATLAARLGGGSAPSAAAAPRGWHLNQGGWQLNAPDGATVALNQAERTFLGMLLRAGGELVPRTDVVERLADGEDDYDPHRLDMLIYRLRGKVETAGMPALPLRVVRGRGYVFIAGPEA